MGSFLQCTCQEAHCIHVLWMEIVSYTQTNGNTARYTARAGTLMGRGNPNGSTNQSDAESRVHAKKKKNEKEMLLFIVSEEFTFRS